MAAEAVAHARRFGWDATVDATLAIYRDARERRWLQPFDDNLQDLDDLRVC